MKQRPDFTTWALGVATAVSARGDCTRRQVGAVILDQDHRIAGAGYNGSYPGGPSCLEGDCPRGRHYKTFRQILDICACGNPWPCAEAVAAGSSYDTGPGACISVHAELNALLDVADRNRLVEASLYVTAEPCDGCLKILRATKIRDIWWRDQAGIPNLLTHPFEKE